MVVLADEAGHDHVLRKGVIHDERLIPGGLLEFIERSHGENPVSRHGDGLRLGLAGIEGDDLLGGVNGRRGERFRREGQVLQGLGFFS